MKPDQEPAWRSGLVTRAVPIRKVVPPQLGHSLAESFNHWFRLRQPLGLSLGGKAFTIHPVADAGEVKASGVTVSLSINGHPAYLRLPDDVVGLVIQELGGSHLPFMDMPQDLLVALMEMATTPWLEQLEQTTGFSIRLTGIGQIAHSDPMMMVDFAVQHETGVTEYARLWCDEAAFAGLAAHWARTRPAYQRAYTISQSLTLRVGVTRLPVRTLRQLGQGDVILMDRSLAQYSQGGLVAGERWIFWANIKEGSLEIVTTAEDIAVPDEGYWRMDNAMNESVDGTEHVEASPDVASDNPETVSFDDLPVKVAFELGRVDISMAELQSLGVGSVLTTKRHLRSPVDIVVNGRKIGMGEIIQVENELGVRLLKVFDHG